MKNRLVGFALRTSLIYWLLSAIWIFFSDRAVLLITSNPSAMVTISIYKGWAYVTIAAVLLYIALRSQLKRWQELTEKQRETEKAIRETEERFQKIYDSAPVGISTISCEGRIIRCNPAFENILGYTESELRNFSIYDLTHQDDIAKTATTFQDLCKGKIRNISLEKRYIRKDGRIVWVSLVSTGIYDERGAFQNGVTVTRDITEHKLADEKIARLTRVYSVLSDINQMVARERDRQKVLDEACRIAVEVGKFKLAWVGMVNKTTGEIKRVASFGTDDGFLDGKDSSPAVLHDDSGGQIMTALNEGRHVILNNIKEIWTGRATYAEALKRGFRSCAIYPLTQLSQTYGMISFYSSEAGFFDEKEESLLQELSNDIAYSVENIEREETRKTLEAQLIQAQRLEGLGTLAGGVAHDFNNILAIIMGYASIMDPTQSRTDQLEDAIEAIKKASQRGAEVVKQLLTVARKTTSKIGPVHVDDIVIEATKLLKETLPTTIDVITELEPQLPLILGDAAQIHQVLLNLCVNARDAMPDGGTIKIITASLKGDKVVSKFPRAPLKEYVMIKVIDTGIGMDEETKTKIFDPFFTTKDVGKGTGLGLSLVSSIVTSHHGFIDVESQPGLGTAFSIFLPTGEQVIEWDLGSRSSTRKTTQGTETILFIEDEELLRDLVKPVIESSGYRVLVAEDGEEALETFACWQDKIAAVISDLGLPKLSGDEVLKRIRSINPNAKLIAASGYIESEVLSKLAGLGVKHILPKPYEPAQILDAIREVLDNGS